MIIYKAQDGIGGPVTSVDTHARWLKPSIVLSYHQLRSRPSIMPLCLSLYLAELKMAYGLWLWHCYTLNYPNWLVLIQCSEILPRSSCTPIWPTVSIFGKYSIIDLKRSLKSSNALTGKQDQHHCAWVLISSRAMAVYTFSNALSFEIHEHASCKRKGILDQPRCAWVSMSRTLYSPLEWPLD